MWPFRRKIDTNKAAEDFAWRRLQKFNYAAWLESITIDRYFLMLELKEAFLAGANLDPDAAARIYWDREKNKNKNRFNTSTKLKKD